MFRFLMLLVSLWIAHAQLGGWSKADPNAAEVQEAASFAVGKKFFGEKPHFTVVQARKQVCHTTCSIVFLCEIFIIPCCVSHRSLLE